MVAIPRLIFFFTFIGLSFFCYGQAGRDDALQNFDALCTLFEENYASFEEKNIDWASTCSEYRKNISSNTAGPELFHIMVKMLRPLNDAHVSLKAKAIDSAFSASRESRILKELKHIPRSKIGAAFKKMTENTLDENGFSPITEIGPKFRGKKLFGYSQNGKIGYLRFFRSFSTLAAMNGPSLSNQLDEIFSSFKGLEAVIVDIRFNIGGDDRFSQSVAGKFVKDPTIGFYKQTRSKGKFGPLETRMIKPNGKVQFLDRKVVLLTNDKSTSAADVLALMMSQLPNVTLIGEASNGSYSDIFEKKLPNGWKVTLSNQRYLSTDKQNYEGKGTPVDIEVKNMAQDLQRKEDFVLLAALEYLDKK